MSAFNVDPPGAACCPFGAALRLRKLMEDGAKHLKRLELSANRIEELCPDRGVSRVPCVVCTQTRSRSGEGSRGRVCSRRLVK